MTSLETSEALDFDRDVPTTIEDIQFLRKARNSEGRNLLTELAALAKASRALKLPPRTSTSEGWVPFEL